MSFSTLKRAFPITMPVLMGYLSIGIAFGLMLERVGYHFIWAFFMSLTVYAGSGQYLGVELVATAASLGTVAIMTFLINFRHLVYGLSFLEKFRGMGRAKFYMIFSLTDETYALLASMPPPVGKEGRQFYLAVAMLNQSYWIIGSVIGGVAGALLPIDITGIEFAMTALFVVIGVEQWKAVRCHIPAQLGFVVSCLFFIVLGGVWSSQEILLITLGVIVASLLAMRSYLEKTVAQEEVSQ